MVSKHVPINTLHCVTTILLYCTVCVYATCRNCPVNACTQYEPRTFSEERQEEEWNSEEMLEFMNTVTQRQGEKERERHLHTYMHYTSHFSMAKLLDVWLHHDMYFFSIELSCVCNKMR